MRSLERRLSLFFMFVLVLSCLPLAIRSPLVFGDVDDGNGSYFNGNYNASVYWRNLNNVVSWKTEYYNGSAWLDTSRDLQIKQSFPDPEYANNTEKLHLTLLTSHAANYRMTLNISGTLMNYASTSSSYMLNYSAFAVIFDWSDIALVSAINLSPVVSVQKQFSFQISKNNIPLGFSFTLDPLFENFMSGTPGGGDYLSTGHWLAQTFTPSSTHTITIISLYLTRHVGYPSVSCGTLTVGIRKTSGGKPTGGDWTSGTYDADSIPTSGAWINISVTEYTVNSGTKYAIVSRISGGNYPNNYILWALGSGTGGAWVSSNSGSTWTYEDPDDPLVTEFYYANYGNYVPQNLTFSFSATFTLSATLAFLKELAFSQSLSYSITTSSTFVKEQGFSLVTVFNMAFQNAFGVDQAFSLGNTFSYSASMNFSKEIAVAISVYIFSDAVSYASSMVYATEIALVHVPMYINWAMIFFVVFMGTIIGTLLLRREERDSSPNTEQI
jgi:hypothetical protein